MAVNTITYANKVTLNENPNIDAVNKCQASDMNEIKNVVNNNANELSQTQENFKGTLLWTNSDTTSDFGEQSINLNSGDYDILEVFYYDYKNTTSMKSVRALKGENIRLDAIFFYSNIMYFSTRTLSYINNAQLNADAGKQAGSNSVGTVSAAPAQCIPVKIIGYKSSN